MAVRGGVRGQVLCEHKGPGDALPTARSSVEDLHLVRVPAQPKGACVWGHSACGPAGAHGGQERFPCHGNAGDHGVSLTGSALTRLARPHLEHRPPARPRSCSPAEVLRRKRALHFILWSVTVTQSLV